MTTDFKPFSTYPEDRAKLLELCATVEGSAGSMRGSDIYAFSKAATELADLVKAILEDEQVAIAFKGWDKVNGRASFD